MYFGLLIYTEDFNGATTIYEHIFVDVLFKYKSNLMHIWQAVKVQTLAISTHFFVTVPLCVFGDGLPVQLTV